MTSGQTALSLSDLPFMYSFLSVLFIWYTGNSDDLARYYIVGVIAGTVGTFFVFWHPIQWILDKDMFKGQKINSSYAIELSNAVPDKYNLQIDPEFFRLSLKTSAIKYLKDKMASLVYFVIILGTLSIALIDTRFQKAIHLHNMSTITVIEIGLIAMLFGLVYVNRKKRSEFVLNVKLVGLYFQISNRITGYKDQSNIIKQAIDLNDWDVAKDMIDKVLRSFWGNLKSYFVTL